MISGFIGGCIGAWLGDGLEVFLRICVLAIVVLWGSALIAWVTPTAALAGALRVYVRPLRFFGAPVDQWSLVMASALRGLPMLRDQAQAVLDTAKLRLGRDIATLSPGRRGEDGGPVRDIAGGGRHRASHVHARCPRSLGRGL